MTNKPTTNEWIEKLASYMHDVRANRFLHQKYNCSDDNMDRREKQARTKYSKLSEEDKEKDRKFAREILDNLPQSISREDISKKETTDEKIEKIMNYIFWEYKDSSEWFSVIPNRVRITLKKHLSYK